MGSEIEPGHVWPTTAAAAVTIQEQLRSRVITTDDLPPVAYVAGVDVGYNAENTIARAAVVVLSFPQLQLVEQVVAEVPSTFPYIPGYLSFREVPAILAAMSQIKTTPHLFLCDGQGLAHPRRFGLACHLGVITNIPSIGVAKSRFIGQHEPLGNDRGSWQPLMDNGEVIGAVVRTRAGVKPIYVSIGHKISLPTAIEYVLRSTPKYRLPETTRLADALASQRRRR